MKIAQAIATLARARSESTTGDAATAALTHAAALAASHSAVVQIIVGGKATVRRFDDGSFLMIGSIALPMMGDLEVVSGDGGPTMAQAVETFEDAIADALIAAATEPEGTGRVDSERVINRENPHGHGMRGVPTGVVPRPLPRPLPICDCPVCSRARKAMP